MRDIKMFAEVADDSEPEQEVKDENDGNEDLIHLEYCMKCREGGQLLCCDTCENTVHLGCANLKEVPDGDWFCPECVCTILLTTLMLNMISCYSAHLTLRCGRL